MSSVLSGVPMSSHSKIYRFIVVIKSAAPLAGQGQSERDVAGPPPGLGHSPSVAQEGNTYKYTQETHKTLTQNNPMTNFEGNKKLSVSCNFFRPTSLSLVNNSALYKTPRP